ncbi:S8 family serine peptidase [Rubrivirga sp.]|uniref:S8 family serine peptidase n=1 Tax=Rubrivirga sp. TaxID=1885344 RepID=UPI003B52B061
MSHCFPTAQPGHRLRGLVVVLSLFFALPAFGQGGALLGPSLQDVLAVASPLTPVEVVVTFDQEGPLTVAQRTALTAVGVRGLFFESLPIAGALATPAQVAQIAALPGVASVWLNEELEYSNDDARQLTGVDRLRVDPTLRTSAGLPFSGQGVAVVVNDSGIDATHADLPYGTKVLENVQAVTNLNAFSTLLPITYLEGTPNTDTNSGHGTHCAGTVAGLGVRSAGLYEGVAPGASLIGYGSGGGLFILDGLGGFDYAITHQFSFEDPIRVITNSWGSDGEFAPESPIVQASYRAFQRGIVVLFAASNSGPGEDTHNIYAQAPWVLSVGAGDRLGALADFSSRGRKGETYDFQTYDGQTWTYTNDVTIVAPGVDIVSTRSISNGTANGGEADAERIAPAHLPFYTMISGTSMATPHVAGIVALLLEADPTLDPIEVKALLQRTATNMPGREAWEVGTGYVNAHGAVAAALGQPVGARALVNEYATFNSRALLSEGASFPVSVFFSPVGEPETVTFEVGPDVTLVKARATVPENTVAIVLTDPAGNRYGSGITLPVLGEIAAVSAPGMAGTWTFSVSGIGSISGVPTDPLGVTNGTALPGQIDATVSLVETAGFLGLDDVGDHPARGFIETAVVERLADGVNRRWFRPDVRLRRGDLARYLVMGTGVRQAAPVDVPAFPAVGGALQPFVEAVTAEGAALKDREGFAPGLMALVNGEAATDRGVQHQELAYSLVGALGLHDIASGYDGDVYATFMGQRVLVEDTDAIDPAYRGYVQLALDAGLVQAQFAVANTPAGPVVTATFGPQEWVSRGEYTAAAVRLFAVYDAVDPSAVSVGGGTSAAFASVPAASATADEWSLEANAPNPFGGQTRIAFSLAEAGPARLAVYDVLGREVAVLAEGPMPEGRHEVSVEAASLAAGTYVYRLAAGGQSFTRQMTVAR